MATTETRTQQNYIGGEWVDAASGDTFESTSPADGELIGVFPQVRRRATSTAPSRPRRRRTRTGASFPRPKRGEILFRFAQLVADHKVGADRAHDARDGEGAGRGGRRRPGSDRHELLHGRRGQAPVRADDAVGAPEQVPDVDADADRRHRRDHAVELPDRDPVLEDRACARVPATPSSSSPRRIRPCSASGSSSSSSRRAFLRAS